jgi:hypothetical protein
MLKNYSVAIWPINLATPLTPLQENQNWVCRKLSDGIKKTNVLNDSNAIQGLQLIQMHQVLQANHAH